MEPYFMVIAIMAVLTTLATVAVYERLLGQSRFALADLDAELDLTSAVNAALVEENINLRAQLAARGRHPAFRVIDGGAS